MTMTFAKKSRMIRTYIMDQPKQLRGCLLSNMVRIWISLDSGGSYGDSLSIVDAILESIIGVARILTNCLCLTL
jgi:hypothetical protein